MEKQGWIPENAINIGARMPALHDNMLIAILAFFALAFSLYYFARKPLEEGRKG
jgi:Gpi18-like mannosyltransferase